MVKPDKNKLLTFLPKRIWQNRTRKHAYILLICLFISIFIWLIIKLSNDYYDTLKFPVHYTNLPEDKIISSGSVSTIYLRLHAQGFKLFSLRYLKNKPTIEIDLKEIKLHKSRYTYSSYITTRPLIQPIAEQLNFENELESIYPDTLYFTLEDIAEKMVPVKTDLNLTFEKQYRQYGEINVYPDSVLLRGTKETLDTVRAISTEHAALNQLKTNRKLKLKLLNPLSEKQLKLQQDSVEVMIPVEKYTEASIELPVQIENNDTSLIKLFPEQVSVTYMVALKDYQKISDDMFRAVAYFSKNKGIDKTLDVKLERHPNFIEIKQITPSRVEYIVLRK